MRHLSAERLAAIADEHPSPDESMHLAQCAPCTDGRDAYRRLVAGAARERERPAAPLSDWGGLSARLRAEGLVRTPETAPVLPSARPLATTSDITSAPSAIAATRRRTVPAWAMRAAAGVALVAGGALAGRVSAPVQVAAVPANDVTRTDTGALVPSPGMMTSAAYSPVAQSEDFFRSTKEAQAAMLRAERTYQAAIKYLAANDTALRPPIEDPVAAYRSRLAAIDAAVTQTRQALKLSPTNPALNDYYLTSVNARETTLRQIDDALPVNERVTRF